MPFNGIFGYNFTFWCEFTSQYWWHRAFFNSYLFDTFRYGKVRVFYILRYMLHNTFKNILGNILINC